ncbi:putative nADH-ubiquinone oxidoreductase chain 4, partial [Chlamydia psittaci 03DC35]
MRHNHNKLNLPTTDRPKITHRILLRKPYIPSNHSLPYSNPLKLLWRN